jgi:hypothetical protein
VRAESKKKKKKKKKEKKKKKKKEIYFHFYRMSIFSNIAAANHIRSLQTDDESTASTTNATNATTSSTSSSTDAAFGDVEIRPDEVTRERRIGLGVYG